jgi:hypothetical protein
MSRILLKDARAAWKKAKPLTLTKTGLSDELRKLEKFVLDKEMASWMPILEHVKASLKTAIADKDIAKEKKAVECLTAISAEVNSQIALIPRLRETINHSLKEAYEAALKILAKPTAEKLAKFDAVIKPYLGTIEQGFHPKSEDGGLYPGSHADEDSTGHLRRVCDCQKTERQGETGAGGLPA